MRTETSKVAVVRSLRASKADCEKPNIPKATSATDGAELENVPASQPKEKTKVTLPAVYSKRAPRLEQQESPVQAAHIKAARLTPPRQLPPSAAPPAASSSETRVPLGSLPEDQLERIVRQQIEAEKKVPRFEKKPESAREPRILDVTCITESSAVVHFDKVQHEAVRLFFSMNQSADMNFLVETSAMCVALTNLLPETSVSLVVVSVTNVKHGKKRSVTHFRTHSAEALPPKLVDISRAREYNDALKKYFGGVSTGKVPKAKSPYE
jgi:hypothetical protein